MLGLPYSNKSFEYTTQVGDEINDSENYLNRVARARKNYMSNWAYNPYFYSRISYWYKINNLYSNFFVNNSLLALRLSLKLSYNYWTSVNYFNNVTLDTSPSYSGLNTPGRSTWSPLSNIQSYWYNNGVLVDILTKREYLYRQYFINKYTVPSLPKYLLSCPSNPLFEEVKHNYAFIDPINYSSESSRELFYQNINLLRFYIIKDFMGIINNYMADLPLNLGFINNFVFYYLFNSSNDIILNRNLDLYKNQYRPMKKGVANMVRLHATGPMALPIETRLHILASSRDVIHSWAIPSAGIKIDCVPGYSSHRVTIFLVSGIYWGQCMEICGRFHH